MDLTNQASRVHFDPADLNPKLSNVLSERSAREALVVPIGIDGTVVTLAVVQPWSDERIEYLRYSGVPREFNLAIATTDEVLCAIDALYGDLASKLYTRVRNQLASLFFDNGFRLADERYTPATFADRYAEYSNRRDVVRVAWSGLERLLSLHSRPFGDSSLPVELMRLRVDERGADDTRIKEIVDVFVKSLANHLAQQ